MGTADVICHCFVSCDALQFFKSRQQMAFLELERFSRTVNGPTFDADYIRAGLERAVTSVEGKKVRQLMQSESLLVCYQFQQFPFNISSADSCRLPYHVVSAAYARTDTACHAPAA
jgi:hypothetical protein